MIGLTKDEAFKILKEKPLTAEVVAEIIELNNKTIFNQILKALKNDDNLKAQLQARGMKLADFE